jgi:hypothetical protein
LLRTAGWIADAYSADAARGLEAFLLGEIVALLFVAVQERAPPGDLRVGRVT